MKRITHFALFIFGMLTLAACQDVVDIDLPDSSPLLVVEGRITNRDSVGVRVTTTAPYFSQARTPRIDGATVRLIEDGVEVGTLAEDSAGFYRLDYLGVPGRKYKIRVEIPDGHPLIPGGTFESITEELRPVPPIDSIYAEFIEDEPPFDDGWYPFYMFTDLPGVGDRYRFKEWRNDTAMVNPGDIAIFQDQFWDGRSFDNVDLPAVRFTGSPKPQGTKYRIELSSISLRFFDYLNLLVSQTAQVGGTFDPPPAPLIGNMRSTDEPDRLVLGFFHASSISTAEVVL